MENKWATLLQEAVSKPGLINRAYSLFHNYSIGNQVAAMVQCAERGIDPGPINTYPGWQKLGRQVCKGQRAIWLCMPLTFKRERQSADGRETEAYEVLTGFKWKPNWFVLSQTDGEPMQMPPIPEWSKDKALTGLDIKQVPFTMTNGNVQGYARKREIAISPLCTDPDKTLFHELAHVVLGHTAEAEFNDSEAMPRKLEEAEAECTALLLTESLGLPGAEYCRGYIQNWLAGDTIPERSAQRIFHAADRILKAGRIQ